MGFALNVGVIGCGYWGPNLIRNFMQLNDTTVIRVADLDEKRLSGIKQNYRSIETTTNYREVVDDPLIDIVVVATPVRTHYRFASEALGAGKHVFVEKPMTASTKEAEDLVRIAQENKRTLMVGHTFLYTEAVKKMKSVIESGELGKIYYINAQRLNLGLFQKDINVTWDLATHDISIILYLLGREPERTQFQGQAHINPAIEDVAILTMYFPDNVVAFVQSSWLDPDKIRKITVVGSKKMMVFDDIQPTEKIRIYDKGVEGPEHYNTFAEFAYSYKYGDIVIPKIGGAEPLRAELSHFVECVKNATTPISDGVNGLQVVRILEQATRLS